MFQECAIRLIDDDGFVVASNQDDVSEVNYLRIIIPRLIRRVHHTVNLQMRMEAGALLQKNHLSPIPSRTFYARSSSFPRGHVSPWTRAKIWTVYSYVDAWSNFFSINHFICRMQRLASHKTTTNKHEFMASVLVLSEHPIIVLWLPSETFIFLCSTLCILCIV